MGDQMKKNQNQNENENENEKKPNSQGPITAIVLAAGKGTRMKSALPKVLHPVAGVPMLSRVIGALKGASIPDIRVVVGFGEKLVRGVVEPLGVHCFLQKQQLGTADAVKSALVDELSGLVFIMNGDHPLVNSMDIKSLVEEFKNSGLDIAVISCILEKPGEFGRVIRHHGELHSIVEAKDASRETLKIKEVNTGVYLMKAELMTELLPKIKNQNSKGEYYLTDIILLAQEESYRVGVIKGHKRLAFGVNSQRELARASRYFFKKKCRQLLDDGVVIIDPENTYIEDSVEVGPASVLYPGVYLRGKTKLGSFCVVEPQVYMVDVKAADGCIIKAGSYLEQAILHARVQVGPYARLRPDTEIFEEAQIGNFVELKKVKFGKKSKAGHLTYLGDAEIGEDVNIGCGTITCNYAVDKKKYKTRIGDGVFVGSDTQFVAPVEIGSQAVIASGSTITKDVPAGHLGVARGRQTNIEGYRQKLDEKLKVSEDE